MGLSTTTRPRALVTASLVALAALAAPVLVVSAGPAAAVGPVATRAPAIVGAPSSGYRIGVDVGEWSPRSNGWTFRWFSDGVLIPGALSQDYAPTTADIGHRLTVEVTGATSPEDRITVTTAPSAVVVQGTWQMSSRPRVRVRGPLRPGSVLRAGLPRLEANPASVGVRKVLWLRDGVRIPGAEGLRYRTRPSDVGHRIRVREVRRTRDVATWFGTSLPRLVRR